MSDTRVKRLTTRSIATAEAIGRREPFTTSGALRAETGRPSWYCGRLNEVETAAWAADRDRIVYSVWSYGTPIAWVTSDGRVHKVDQRFSITTTRHQGNLYLLREDVTA